MLYFMQMTVIMALVNIRSCGRHGLHLGLRAYATRPLGTPRKREQQDDTPVFQYVGQHRKPQEKVFVWGFSYTGALGIPSFVVPDSGRKKPRKYQLTPYRLETEEKVTLFFFSVLLCLYFLITGYRYRRIMKKYFPTPPPRGKK